MGERTEDDQQSQQSETVEQTGQPKKAKARADDQEVRPAGKKRESAPNGAALFDGEGEEVADLLERVSAQRERRQRVQDSIGECLDQHYGRWDILKESDSWAWDTCSLPPAITESLGDLVRRLMAKQKLSLSDISCRSGLSRDYLGDLIQGKIQPRRNKLIQIAFGLQLDVPEACLLLERGEAASLSELNRRDVVIALCLHWRIDLSNCDSMLYELGERTVRQERPAA